MLLLKAGDRGGRKIHPGAHHPAAAEKGRIRISNELRPGPQPRLYLQHLLRQGPAAAEGVPGHLRLSGGHAPAILRRGKPPAGADTKGGGGHEAAQRKRPAAAVEPDKPHANEMTHTKNAALAGAAFFVSLFFSLPSSI